MAATLDIYIYIYIYIYSASFLRQSLAQITHHIYNMPWSHEATKNVLNANKMTKINEAFRCTYVTIDVYTNTGC